MDSNTNSERSPKLRYQYIYYAIFLHSEKINIANQNLQKNVKVFCSYGYLFNNKYNFE